MDVKEKVWAVVKYIKGGTRSNEDNQGRGVESSGVAAPMRGQKRLMPDEGNDADGKKKKTPFLHESADGEDLDQACTKAPSLTRVNSNIGETLEEFYKNLHDHPRDRSLVISCLPPEKRHILPFKAMLKMLHDNTDQDTAPFPLMKLPAELRRRIFQFALLRHTVYPYMYREGHRGEAPYVNLLRANSQVYDEAMDILYKHNRFSFSSLPDVDRFTTARQQFEQAHLIWSIQLAPDVGEDPKHFVDDALEEGFWDEHWQYVAVLKESWFGIEGNSEEASAVLHRLPCLDTVRVDVTVSGCQLCGDDSHEVAGEAIFLALFESFAQHIEVASRTTSKNPARYFKVHREKIQWGAGGAKARQFYHLMRVVRRMRRRQVLYWYPTINGEPVSDLDHL